MEAYGLLVAIGHFGRPDVSPCDIECVSPIGCAAGVAINASGQCDTAGTVGEHPGAP